MTIKPAVNQDSHLFRLMIIHIKYKCIGANINTVTTQTSGLPWEALAAVTVIFLLLLYFVERNTWYLLSLLFYLTLDPFQGLWQNSCTKFTHGQRWNLTIKIVQTVVHPFLYNCHVKVRPVVIPLTLASVQDFQRLEEAAHATKRYLFRFQHNNQAALKAGLLRIYQSYNLYSIDSLII